MDGTDLGGESATISRAVFLAVALYFALVAYGTIANEPLATYAAAFVFGAIALGLGAILYLRWGRRSSTVLAAAVCLAVGGVLQFAYLFSQSAALDSLSSLVVFAGVGLYVYAAWTAE
ncbi:hypothetical protein [Halopiger xanaduensis]|uniref:Uncharacterized protein n=1 Tax=Halopiger xanaduensis (strain DSM 18323 / JCM 14033 / SH-6) TaxID=797210 RepID=F8D3W9_HALXS|nr:hypothetical protein [Halopiger xanaduensis]AEH38632.1 hypothetical protein Halxa_4027 [Halopiger xanaduensis SH-6]